MPEREAAGVGFEEFDRVLAGLGGPIKVQLHLNEFGIGFVEQDIIRMLAVFGNEFEVVVMVAELDTCFFAFLAGYIEIGGDRKSTRLNSSHPLTSRMPSSA